MRSNQLSYPPNGNIIPQNNWIDSNSMKILRFSTPDLSPRYGWLHEARIGQLDGDPFSAYRRLDPEIPVDSVTLLQPVKPSKIICVGRNFEAHAREMDNPVDEIPLLFSETSQQPDCAGQPHYPAAAIPPGAARSGTGRGDRQTGPLDPPGQCHGPRFRLHHRQ